MPPTLLRLRRADLGWTGQSWTFASLAGCASYAKINKELPRIKSEVEHHGWGARVRIESCARLCCPGARYGRYTRVHVIAVRLYEARIWENQARSGKPHRVLILTNHRAALWYHHL